MFVPQAHEALDVLFARVGRRIVARFGGVVRDKAVPLRRMAEFTVKLLDRSQRVRERVAVLPKRDESGTRPEVSRVVERHLFSGGKLLDQRGDRLLRVRRGELA